jgi:MFS family permease|tara:strand:+ start:283 stop:1482 length:1200 start_codon:yes stop_codon:yes gene_type:complete
LNRSHIKQNTLKLWSAQTVSATGDAVYQLALVWIILEITESTLATGLVAMGAHLPAILFGIFAGVLADRHNRIRLMLFSNFSQAIVVAIIPILLFVDIKIGFVIGILAFVRASFGSLFPPAMNAFLPELFPRDSLMKINSLIATSGQFAYLAGPALAGILLNVMSVKLLFVWDAMSFLLAGLLLLTIRSPNKIRKSNRGVPFQELKSGFTYLKTHGSIGLLIILTIVNNIFIMGPAIVGMPIMIKHYLSGSASDFAFVEAGMALGMLTGSFFMYRFAQRFKSGFLLLLGMLWDGLTYALFFWVQSVPMALFIIIFHGMGIPVITVSRTAILQKYTPNNYHGRLFSMVHLAVSGMTAVSTALVGILAEFVSIHIVFLLFGIGGTLTGLIGFLNRKILNYQ